MAVRARRGLALPVVLGILLLLEALAALAALQLQRLTSQVSMARGALLVRAALVEAMGEAQWAAPAEACAEPGGAIREGRSAAGVSYRIRWVPVDSGLVRAELEAWTDGMGRGESVALLWREPSCDLFVVPGLPPTL